MRKSLVVVCAATSALVLAGGVAATAADAGETPDRSGWSGWALPDLADFAGFGFGGADDGAFHDGTARDTAGAADVLDRPAVPAAERPAAQRPAMQRPAPQRPAVQRPAMQRPAAQHPAPQRPAAQRPAMQRPAMQRPAAFAAPGHQRPAADRIRPAAAGQRPAALLSAARAAVTAADVSSSPHARVQRHVLALVNDNRRRHGCDDLSVDRRLIEAANEHAADMARRDYFAHESPDGDNAGERVSEAGYRWKRYGENIARGADSPYEVVDGWMHSPSHRHNILDCRLEQMGIGLAIAGDRTPYWVQDFATPRE